MVHLYEYVSGVDIPTDATWRWLDPGMIAVMGSSSMLGGVTRLALASTIIVVCCRPETFIHVQILYTHTKHFLRGRVHNYFVHMRNLL